MQYNPQLLANPSVAKEISGLVSLCSVGVVSSYNRIAFQITKGILKFIHFRREEVSGLIRSEVAAHLSDVASCPFPDP